MDGIGGQLLISGVSSFVVALTFYFLAGKQLRAEIESLRHLTAILVNGLSNLGLLDIHRGPDGTILGLNVTVVPGEGVKVSDKALALIRKAAGNL